MEATNQPAPVILSDADLAQLEAQPSRLINGLEGILLSPGERDALCATVRALREAQQPTRQVLETYLNEGEQSPLGLHDLAHMVTERLHSGNTALHEQLAELQRRNDTQSESIMELQAEEKSLKARLAQVEKEREYWRGRATEADKAAEKWYRERY